ncbi:uncharacterized protein FIBRA_04078 [Fibroporia radiculosa]|uniref:C-CAP/cofactor C-like domain-containing protein n=1 Tax=Fibroporia radiculosa TaxID=599839 RepID=J4H2R9_9APHY|nr:uncharacterized protein FIBRA_04078 [Fibroporia radiculosa]CCM02004.1 predicted protein [Fibroporia radiculosa]
MSASNQALSQEFYAHFQATRSDLLARLDVLSTGKNNSEVVEQLAVDVLKLRKGLTDATDFLPAYDQRQCDIRMKEIEETLQKLRAASSGKPKFAFKRKANKPTIPLSSETKPTTEPVFQPHESDPSSGGLSLSNHSYQYLTLGSIPTSSASSDLTISELDHCIVNLLLPDATHASISPPPKITALHVRNVRNSVLILPRIDGSALLHDLSRCVFVLGCHQYRMHASSDTDVYISVSSNPIIEHCTGIRFSGYPQLFLRSGAFAPPKDNMSSSDHLAVQDFSHIRATPSPNWSILPASEVIPDEQWLLSANVEKVGVDSILEKLIPRP